MVMSFVKMGDIGNATDLGDHLFSFEMFNIFMRHQNEDVKNALGYSSLESKRKI